ncbi:MAG TPA: ABC transporter permease [Archaeoglobaceae archaeon]|nr:ABC transporter permease [Archaeoglobaceae archaeon]
MYLELAKRNLLRTKVRSSLAVIGIIIGVMAIASIGIFGESLKASVLQNFQDVANELLITPAFSQGYSEIEREIVDKIEKSPSIRTFIPLKNTRDFIEYKSKKNYGLIYGIDEKSLEELFEAEKGSIKLRGSCVVGNSIADMFDLRAGSKISVAGREFRISAILKEEGARFDLNPNNIIFLERNDFDKLFDEGYSMIIVKVEKLEDVEKIKEYIEKKVNSRDEKVTIFEMKILLERIEEVFAQMTLFLMAIAGISLLVAGVSILNIMLMSTIERTKEIGVMRAIGAYRETILKIFMLEALILGIIGSATGGVLSLAGGFGIDMLVLGSAEHLFTPSTAIHIIEGISFGILTALVSGLYPAWKASKLEPIEALRYE